MRSKPNDGGVRISRLGIQRRKPPSRRDAAMPMDAVLFMSAVARDARCSGPERCHPGTAWRGMPTSGLIRRRIRYRLYGIIVRIGNIDRPPANPCVYICVGLQALLGEILKRFIAIL